MADLMVDVLASWKSNIGEYEGYVLRSSVEWNGEIVDTTYPATGDMSYSVQQGKSPWTAMSTTDILANGTIVVSIAGAGAPIYYAMPYSTFIDMMSYIYSDNFLLIVTEGWSSVYDQLKVDFDPMQYIKSVMWFPWQESGGNSKIKIGYWEVPYTARIIAGGQSLGVSQFAVQRHPQSGRGKYLNLAPYSRYRLFYPGWGVVELDGNAIANNAYIQALYNVDMRTGNGVLRIYASNTESGDNQHLLSTINTQIGVPWEVSQMRTQGTGLSTAIQTGISVASSIGAGFASGGYAGATVGAISSGLSAIGDAASRNIPMVSSVGSAGSMGNLVGYPLMMYEFMLIVDEDLAHRGRPLCEVRKVSTLPGFLLLADADISAPCTAAERDQVRQMTQEGFFYE